MLAPQPCGTAKTAQAPAGAAQSAVCRHPRQSRFTRVDRHRPRPSRDADNVCRYPDHDLPGAKSRGRSGSRPLARAIVQGRTAGVSAPQLVSRRGLRQRGHASGSDWRFRRATSFFWTRWQVALSGRTHDRNHLGAAKTEDIGVSYRAAIGSSRSRSARLCQIVVFRRVQVHPGHGVDPAQMVVNFLHPGNVLGTDDGGLP